MENKELIEKIMENKNTIHQDLVKLQSELTTIQKNKTGYITKTAKFKYADLTAIWEHIRKPLTNNNFAIVQLIDSEEDKTYIITQLIHSSGEMIASRTFVPGRAIQPKESGILYTYYKRYALSSILGLTTDEDADQYLPQQKEMFEENIATIDKAEEEHLKKLFKKLNSGATYKEILKKYGIKSLDQLPEIYFDGVCEVLGKRIEMAKKQDL